MIGKEKSQAQPRNIEGSGIIARAVPQTRGIATTQPGRPLQRFVAIRFGGRAVGVCGLATTRAGGCATARLDLPGSDPTHIPFLLEDAPHLTPPPRLVTPISPP